MSEVHPTPPPARRSRPAPPRRRRAAPAPSPDGGRKFLAKRDRILEIAVAAFRQKGYAGTSTQDISRELQLTKGSLYYYFRDKEDILFQCHDRALEHVLEIAREVRRRHPDPADALRALIERHVGIMVQEFRGTALALEFGALSEPRLRSVLSRRDRYEGVLRRVIQEGIDAGAFRPVDVKLASFAIFGAINWISRWYREDGGTRPEEIGRFFADLFVRALERRPAGPRAGAGRRTRS